VLLVGAGITVAATVGVPPLTEVRTWVQAAGWAGPVLYSGLYALASMTPAPASVMTIGAGALFGWGVGVPVAFCGALVGALAGFAMSRTLGRSTVEGLAGERLARLDAMLRERGLLAVIGIRMVPLGPFAIVNATCGLTAVRARDYVAGTAIGLLPGSVTFVAVGAFGTSPGSVPFLLAVLAVVLLVGIGVMTNNRRALAARSQTRGASAVPAQRPGAGRADPDDRAG